MPSDDSKLLMQTDSAFAHYEVWDTVYGGRPARVLYSGQHRTAQSGVPLDYNPDLLFDYNQRLLELVLGLRPKRMLLIGGGVYTLPMALVRALPEVSIDVVEIDEGLDAIATRYFNFQSNERLRIMHADGRQFLDSNSQPYDVLIVDAFLGSGTPDSLKNLAAIQTYRRNLTPNGVLARNIISAYRGEAADALRQQLADYDQVFGRVSLFPASYNVPLGVPQNLILLAQPEQGQPLDGLFRYQALERP